MSSNLPNFKWLYLSVVGCGNNFQIKMRKYLGLYVHSVTVTRTERDSIQTNSQIAAAKVCSCALQVNI